ncbi:MAG: HAD family hydrolase [Planctomycetota bacterium]
MWSGPRNISTAMMRAWGNRSDTVVCDEPLYAHYLLETGVLHPGREEVIAHHDTDWRRVVSVLTGPLPPGKTIFYQKHMAHHLLPGIDRGWLAELRHCFLLREPAEMLMSLVKNLPEPRLEDTGLPQQLELFRRAQDLAGPPPVVDARDVLENPRGVLRQLCAALQVPFEESMLCWPPGQRDTDGIWAKHWYDAVLRSTSFIPYQAKHERLAGRLRALYEQCLVPYQELYRHRLRA